MRIWDIYCGTKSVSNVWRSAGHEALTLDIDPKCQPDICTDLVTWEYTDFSLEPPDFIWFSPPCTMYSIARTRAILPSDLEGSDKIIRRCLLKTREVIQGLNFKDLDYCMYQDPPMYRKRIRLWTNCTWIPRPLCTHETHRFTAQKGPSKRAGMLIQGDDCSLQTLHSVPVSLTRELMLYCENEAQTH